MNSTKDNTGKDGLDGEEDLDTDGTNMGGWGGLGGHVSLESRGAGWIVHPHIQFEVASPAFDAATVSCCSCCCSCCRCSCSRCSY